MTEHWTSIPKVPARVRFPPWSCRQTFEPARCGYTNKRYHKFRYLPMSCGIHRDSWYINAVNNWNIPLAVRSIIRNNYFKNSSHFGTNVNVTMTFQYGRYWTSQWVIRHCDGSPLVVRNWQQIIVVQEFMFKSRNLPILKSVLKEQHFTKRLLLRLSSPCWHRLSLRIWGWGAGNEN